MRFAATQAICDLSMLPSFIRFCWRHSGASWKINTHLTRCERLLLYKLGLSQPPGAVMVEIGSYLGASSCFLAAAAQVRGGKLHCVDTWLNDGMTEGRRDTWNEFSKNTLPFSPSIRTHRGTSTDIAVNFKDRIDLLFVDGDHSYEACKADLKTWFPYMVDGTR